MTIIEYYSEIALENAASTLAYGADETVLIYDEQIIPSRIKAAAVALRTLFRKRIQGYRGLTLLPVNTSDIFLNADLIANIAREKEECIFDLTGGEESIMVSMGMAAERLGSNRIHMHQFLLRQGKSICCHRDLPSHSADDVRITVSELISLHGGKCRAGYVNDNPAFTNLVNSLWDISRANPAVWNRCLFLLNSSRGNAGKGARSLYAGRMSDITVVKESAPCKDIILRLIAAGALSLQGDRLYYSDHTTMDCFLKNGNVLELTARRAIIDLLRRSNRYFPGAVEFEAIIEWQNSAVRNEIDVIFMNGLIPVFVSCKNGAVDDEELYKFKIVSEQFGGEEGVKILLVSPSSLGDNTDSFIARARHLGIRVISNVRSMTIGQLSYEISRHVDQALRRL